jgi:DNA-binding FrmR family transcriptional regulator
MAQQLEKDKCCININRQEQNVHSKLEWNVITDYLSHNFSKNIKTKTQTKTN